MYDLSALTLLVGERKGSHPEKNPTSTVLKRSALEAQPRVISGREAG